MYLSWKGIAVSTLLGAGVGAGIGYAKGNTAMGAGIGAAAGAVLPVTAEVIEGWFDGDRAKAVSAMKKLRAAAAAGEGGDAILAFTKEMDEAVKDMTQKASAS